MKETNLLVVAFEPDGASIVSQDQMTDHGEAHLSAERMARAFMADGAYVRVYQEIACYQAEVKVTMRKAGE